MQVSNQIIEVLNYLGEKLGVTIDWTSENVFPYIQTLCGKYINWEIATSIVWIVIGLILIILAIISFKGAKDPNIYDEGFLYIVFVILLILGVIVMFAQIFDIIKCIYIPELQIYEYIKSLMRT